MSANFTPEMDDYKKIKKGPIFIKFVLENFPLIADDFDAMTYYGALCKIVDYMKKLIDNEKALENNMTALYDAYNQLQDYVNHYFDNLDIQEEINNKLDEMAESGQLTDIIAQYLQLAGVLAYDTKTNMKQAQNLADGSIAKTLGNATYNDGQGSYYRVRTILNTDVIDNVNIIALHDNTLVAEKINDNFIYITTSMDEDEIVRLIELPIPKTVVFEKGSYTITQAWHIPNNTIIDLNGSTVDFNFTALYNETIGIYGYKFDDTFTGYSGNEFVLKNGTISQGSIALMHNINTRIENIEFINMLHAYHVIQISACKNLTIKDCTFNGITIPDPETEENYIFKEVINIDPCTYGAQPYMEEDSPMYDNTVNEGIYIIDNVFNNGDGTHNKCYVCIGSHAAIENYATISKHILIKNNKFNYAYYSCFQFTSLEDVEIDNNYFNGYNARSTVTFLMTRVTNKDFKLTNNKVENICEFIHSGSQNASYWNEDFIIDNNIIKNTNVTPNEEATFNLMNYKNIYIGHNYIECSNICLRELVNCINIIFEDNEVISAETNNIIIKLYGGATSTGNKVLGNRITALSNSSYCIAIDGQTDYVIGNNSYTNRLKFLGTNSVTRNVFNNTALYPITDLIQMPNTNNNYIDPTYGIFSNFKSLQVLVGSSANTCVVELKPFLYNGEYLDSRTYKATFLMDNDTPNGIKLTIDTTTNKYMFASALPVRQIYGTD